jgi:hypothetical protein
VLWLWPLAQQSGWRNYWFDDRYLYDQAATMQERFGLLGDDPRELDAVRDRMPLYPLLLRGLRRLETLTAIPVPAWSILLNVIAHAATCLMVFHLIHQTTGRLGTARGAAFLLPWLPGVMPYTLAQLPEAVSTTLGLASGALVVSIAGSTSVPVRRVLIAGLLLGIATLLKPVFCFYCVPLAILVWSSAGAGRLSPFPLILFFALTFLLPLTPWVSRNYAVWGVVTLTPNGSAHLANARDALAGELGLPPLHPQLPHTDHEWRSLSIDPTNLPVRSAFRSCLAWEELRQRLPAVVGASLKSLVKLHASTGVGTLVTISHGELAVGAHDHQPEPRQSPHWSMGWYILQIGFLVILVCVYVLSIMGLWFLWKNQYRVLFCWAGLTLAYFVLVSVPFGNTRYRYPAMPAYAVLAAAGVACFIQRWSRRTLA